MRKFAPSEFEGEPASVKTVAERRALIGKRIGYDLRGSCMSHFGTVEDARGTEISIDGSWYHRAQLEQVVILTDQGT